MKASVIVTCYNSRQHIEPCIESILKSDAVDFELIVIDDGSTDGSREILKNVVSNKHLKTISLEKNSGATASRNTGATHARGEYLVFLDIDCRLQKLSLFHLLEPFKNKRIGMTQAVLLKMDGSVESAGHFLSPIGFPYNIDTAPTQLSITLGTRTALAIRRDVFDIIGGYDEDYMIYGEDTDLSWRTWLAGYSVYVVPKATIYHLQKSSMSAKTNFRIYYEGSKNLISVLLKNGSPEILFLLIPMNILVWVIISIKLIFQGKFEMTKWIYKGIWWNVVHFEKTQEKRKQIAHFRKQYVSTTILFGKLPIGDFFRKGLQWAIGY